MQSSRRILLQDIKRGQVSMKTRRARLDFQSFAETFLRVLVPTGSNGQSAQVIPKDGHKRV